MSEKLRPCPQCGGDVRYQNRKIEYSCFLCIECEMDLPYDYQEWKIVKQIDRQQQIIKVMREALEKIHEGENYQLNSDAWVYRETAKNALSEAEKIEKEGR